MKKTLPTVLTDSRQRTFSFLFLPHEPIVYVIGKIERSRKIIAHYLFQLFRIAFGISGKLTGAFVSRPVTSGISTVTDGSDSFFVHCFRKLFVAALSAMT